MQLLRGDRNPIPFNARTQMSSDDAVDWVVFGLSLLGLSTVRLQHELVFNLSSVLSRNSHVGRFFSRKAHELLEFPVRLLLYLSWLLAVVSTRVVPFRLADALQKIVVLFLTILAPFFIFRGLKFVAVIVNFVATVIIKRQLWASYVEDALPLAIAALSLVVAILVFLGYLRKYTNLFESFVSLLDSFIGVTAALGLIMPIRSFVGCFSLLLDDQLDIGDLIEIRGVAGRLVKIGSLKVFLRKTGSRDMEIPGNDFLTYPYINHSHAGQRGARLEIYLRHEKGRDADFYRKLSCEITEFLSKAASVWRCRASYFSKDTESTDIDVYVPTIIVTWQVRNEVGQAYMSTRSNLVLELTEWLEERGIETC